MDNPACHLYPSSISINPKTRKLIINQIPSFKFFPTSRTPFKQNQKENSKFHKPNFQKKKMPSETAKSGNKKPSRSKIKPISVSDPKPNTQILSHQSFIPKPKNSPPICSRNESSKMPKKKRLFTLVTLKGMGCKGVSSPASVPAAIRSAPEKLRRKKKKHSKSTTYNAVKSPGNVVIDVPEVCCTPPKIGFAYDVAPIGKLKSHRQHSRVARRTANLGQSIASPLVYPFSTTSFSRTNVSNSSRYHRLLQLPEMIMFHNGSLSERSLNQSDRFGDWRLNLDPMLYEELLELSDRIGYVGAGLQEDEILGCLSQTNTRTSLSSIMCRNEETKCSICQEECKGNDELGRLACGHYHHIDCIKQWLLLKNECPLCKTAAR